MEVQERKSSLIGIVPIFVLLLGVIALAKFEQGKLTESNSDVLAGVKGQVSAAASNPAPLELDPGRFLVLRDPTIAEGERLKITFRGDKGFAIEVKPEIVRQGLAIVKVPIYTDPATGRASEGIVWVYLKESKSRNPLHINRLPSQ
jgi:hypothetical protein